MELELYFFESCPFCQMVLRYLKTSGLELTYKDIQKSQNYHKELLEGGGKRQVPCLRIGRGFREKWLYESEEIISYLDKIVAS